MEDPQKFVQIATVIIDLINAGGSIVILVGALMLFIRGDIITRQVYEKLLRDLLSKIAADVIASVSQLMKEQNTLTDSRLKELSDRFNHIEECIDRIRESRF